MKERISKVLDISGNLLLVLVILICVPLTVPRLFGYNIYSVISGSMEPAIKVYDVVIDNLFNTHDTFLTELMHLL